MKEIRFPAKPDFRTAYEENYGKVYNFVYRMVLHTQNTEDIVSETFLKAMEAWPQYDSSKASPCTWLCSIARNCAVNFLRSGAYAKNVSMEALLEGGALPEASENPWGEDSAESAVWDILRHLTVREREFLNWRYVLDLSNGEIARKLGISEKAVSDRYRRLLAKCEKIARSPVGADK